MKTLFLVSLFSFWFFQMYGIPASEIEPTYRRYPARDQTSYWRQTVADGGADILPIYHGREFKKIKKYTLSCFLFSASRI